MCLIFLFTIHMKIRKYHITVFSLLIFRPFILKSFYR